MDPRILKPVQARIEPETFQEVLFTRINASIQILMTADYTELYATAPAGKALTVISNYTGISDLDWLFEVFRTGSATTPEEAVLLYNQELEDNAAPFVA